MKTIKNKGFEPSTIASYRERIKVNGGSYVLDDQDEQTDEYVHFYFVGEYDGAEVVYDAAMYTLRLHHESELYEIAEDRASKRFPKFKKISYDEDQKTDSGLPDPLADEVGLYMAEVILELEEEGTVKVQEHVDQDTEAEFGISLDIGLHVEAITPSIITKFVQDFNSDALSLDDTLYSFEIQDNDAD
jgi:hypothetical protein